MKNFRNGNSKFQNIIKQHCTLEQAKLYKNISVNGINYLLYDVLDWLGSGIIYDIKYKEKIGNYNVGDYFDNTQHRTYFALVDDAYKFVYLISNGSRVYQEAYSRQEYTPIYQTIADFERWLKFYCLWDTYTDKWRAK